MISFDVREVAGSLDMMTKPLRMLDSDKFNSNKHMELSMRGARQCENSLGWMCIRLLAKRTLKSYGGA